MKSRLLVNPFCGQLCGQLCGQFLCGQFRNQICNQIRNRFSGRFSSLFSSLIAVFVLAACGTFDKDPTAKWDADRIYAEAKNELSVGNYPRAREYLEKLESRYPFTRYAQQAQIEIAYTYYKEGESAQAVTAADRFLKLNPNHPNADYVQYLKGRASFNDELGFLGATFGQEPSTRDPKAMREAFDAYKELVTRYPASPYATDATARMNYLVNTLAKSEVNVARFYLERGAYLAAIQRAQTALRDYQGAPVLKDALLVMIDSYRALNLPDLAADTEKVLLKNFAGK